MEAIASIIIAISITAILLKIGYNRNKSNSEIKKIQDKNPLDIDITEQQIFNYQESKFQHQNKKIQLRAEPNKNVDLGTLLNRTLNIRSEELSDMYVISKSINREEKYLTESSEIWNFDLCKSVLNCDENGVYSYKEDENVTLIISYRKEKRPNIDQSLSNYHKNESILVHLQGTRYAKGSWYISATICIPPSNFEGGMNFCKNCNETHSLTVLFAFDEIPSQQRIAEFKYMQQDAFDKAEKKQFDQLTDEQTLLLNQFSPSINKSLYWGKKAFNDKRYWDAILNLENAFNFFCKNYDSLSENEREIFFETCYLIGFCYNDMHLYKMALYYLEIIHPIKNIAYVEEYINCLANMEDLRAIYVINEHLEILSKVKELNEQQISFYHFLYRRLGYVYIDKGRLDDAEKIFSSMLDLDPDNSLILNELAYIKKVRENS